MPTHLSQLLESRVGDDVSFVFPLHTRSLKDFYSCTIRWRISCYPLRDDPDECHHRFTREWYRKTSKDPLSFVSTLLSLSLFFVPFTSLFSLTIKSAEDHPLLRERSNVWKIFMKNPFCNDVSLSFSLSLSLDTMIIIFTYAPTVFTKSSTQ